MSVTPKTITDEQLRQLIKDAEQTANDARFALLRLNAAPTDVALERCAAAWNARYGATK